MAKGKSEMYSTNMANEALADGSVSDERLEKWATGPNRAFSSAGRSGTIGIQGDPDYANASVRDCDGNYSIGSGSAA